jgi:predicted CoA-substrate-specific enzyme activase
MNEANGPKLNEMRTTFEGLEVGAISVKWVQRDTQGTTRAIIRTHNGKPREALEAILAEGGWGEDPNVRRMVITGQAAKLLVNAPYRSTTECLEKALAFYGKKPDLLLALGGETFSVYPMKDGVIKNVIATSKCAAGTGEFIVQQFQRMGMTLEQGLQAYETGKRVQLATRCSVHCKSDATHKLNKGECSRGDIARSLIEDLAQRVVDMVGLAKWPARKIVVSGGVAANRPFMDALENRLTEASVELVEHSPCLEAFGASLLAEVVSREAAGPARKPTVSERRYNLDTLPPLRQAEHLLDYRVKRGPDKRQVVHGGGYILAVDAGSTTTKAVLLNVEDGSVGASCYLRTLGNPIAATTKCLGLLAKQVSDYPIRIVQTASTGSGREMVSVFLENGLSFNEILAHARAAADQVRDVGTVFEIGGQDSKYVSFANGIPVGYAMNEGCSAGTGSFLEESAFVDMGIATEAIGAMAESSESPLAFGERCAAFINTDIRNALQQGARPRDVIAGLVYSIADNYISRIVGPRPVREDVLFLGGVALNRSVALAIAARTGRKLVVPPHPELMGCVGAALMARDRLSDGRTREARVDLNELTGGQMEVKGSFRCRSCDNVCEVHKIEIRSRIYPFGGLCSKYELQRRKDAHVKEGRDLVAGRNRMMFEDFLPRSPYTSQGTIGLPMALSTYELFPYYAKLVSELGFSLVMSEGFRGGMQKTMAAICYPCQIVHGAVDDLVRKGVDFILLPRLLELDIPDDRLHGYTCPSTAVIPDVVRAAFSEASDKLLAPHIGFSSELRDTSIKEIERLAPVLGVPPSLAARAAVSAFEHLERYRHAYEQWGKQALAEIAGEPSVVLAGRPYTVYSSAINLALPRKITSRGYHAIPADLLPMEGRQGPNRDVWHFTQKIGNAVQYVKDHPNMHVCLVSCFSCGPDGVMYHLFREQLAGRPFCYLEIDSHTAHAGFETRVGAFLDIIEEQKRTREQMNVVVNSVSRADKAAVRLARLSDDKDCIISSSGARVEYRDPRVVHVFTDVTNAWTARLIETAYKKYGGRCRIVPRPTAHTMQLARKVCSGRECVPMIATAGAMVHDLSHDRSQGEVTVYLTLDQEGPCQNGAWPLVWESFLGRLGARNAMGGVNRNPSNRQLGFSGAQIQEINKCVLLGDLLEEARNALVCLARDRDSAMNLFDQSFKQIIDTVGSKDGDLETAIERWAEQMAELPLISEVNSATKVLIIGGLNLIFVHYPVSEYFLDQGILVKVVDVAEGALWIESEGFVRVALKNGITEPGEQMAFRPSKQDRDDAIRVRTSRYGVNVIDAHLKKLRSIMAKSGLMFEDHIEFSKILEAGHRHVSNNAFSETSIAVGRFVCSEASNAYDGLVNLGCFNCQPAMNSQAVIRPLASRSEMPYVALDCEGPWISANQTRILEALAVQARRKRLDKNRLAKGSDPNPPDPRRSVIGIAE